MLIRHRNQGFEHPLGSEITPQTRYLQRRAFMQALAMGLRVPHWPAGLVVMRWLPPSARICLP